MFKELLGEFRETVDWILGHALRIEKYRRSRAIRAHLRGFLSQASYRRFDTIFNEVRKHFPIEEEALRNHLYSIRATRHGTDEVETWKPPIGVSIEGGSGSGGRILTIALLVICFAAIVLGMYYFVDWSGRSAIEGWLRRT